MPYPLTHLEIAYKILKNRADALTDPAQFLLGSIAPDAVHYRSGFSGADKKITHLCVGDERWGEVTNNEEWQNNVLSFLAPRVRTAEASFFYGYAAHILSDIFNNVHIWQPFRQSEPEEAALGYTSEYYQELNRVNQCLFRAAKDSALWSLLASSRPLELPGLVSADEINALLASLSVDRIRNQSNDSSDKTQPNTEYRYMPYDKLLAFIDQASVYVAERLFP